jgi:predicted RNase H-like HicB family nuclease
MAKYSIDVRWSDADEEYVAVCPELGNLSALGPSPHEAVQELEKAIELAIETYESEGWPLPPPRLRRSYSGQFRVRLPLSLHARLALEAEREDVSLNTYLVSRLSEVPDPDLHLATLGSEFRLAALLLVRQSSSGQTTFASLFGRPDWPVDASGSEMALSGESAWGGTRNG